MLQRGRARVGAEFWPWRTCQGWYGPASTGPRPRGRGIFELLAPPAGLEFKPLQRGRARVGAELSRVKTSSPGNTSSFNGAAPAWARNFHPDAGFVPAQYSLQRGRARVGAELRRKSRSTSRWEKLQRGRARVGAEFASVFHGNVIGARGFNGAAPAWARNSSRADSSKLVESGFNGAAPAWARNSCGWTNSNAPIKEASTGPRPRGRGIRQHHQLPMHPACRLQRGRARVGAEFGVFAHARGRERGFNGAAPAWARNSPSRSPPSISSNSFNGAAPAWARNFIYQCRAWICRLYASTGPRPRGRGIAFPSPIKGA